MHRATFPPFNDPAPSIILALGLYEGLFYVKAIRSGVREVILPASLPLFRSLTPPWTTALRGGRGRREGQVREVLGDGLRCGGEEGDVAVDKDSLTYCSSIELQQIAQLFPVYCLPAVL